MVLFFLVVPQLFQQLVYLAVEGGSVVEDDVVSASAFFFFVHLLGHACLDLLGGGMVALDGPFDAEGGGCIDFDGDIDGVLKA